MFLKILVIALIFLAEFASAEELICKGNEGIKNPCYETRGRLQVGNGTPYVTMWKVGTKRILGITTWYEEELMMPQNLKEQIGISRYVFGNYVVCPFTEDKPGWMQMVCIESADNLRVEEIQ